MLRIASLIVTGCVLAACAPDGAVRGAAAPAAVVAIGAVQGRADASPRVGDIVVVEGTVTGEFGAGLGGGFVQDGGDGDPATSDALFVETLNRDARALDRVRIRGRVAERDAGKQQTLTTLEPLQIEVLGHAQAPAATLIDAAPVQTQDWEKYEGMRLRIAAPLTLNGSHNLSRYGELVAGFDGRLYTPTEIAMPGDEADATAADNARRTLLLDDGSAAKDPKQPWYLADPQPRTGSLIEDAVGILDQRLGGYRLQLTEPLRLRAAPRPSPPRVGGDVRIASLNLENLFNGDGKGSGFPTPRGARTPAQFATQLSKLVATIRALDPDIAALMELENDGYGPTSTLAQLVAALNTGGGDWRFVDAKRGPGSDEIRVGLVYRAARIKTVGRPATLEDGPFDRHSRAPLAQAFRAGRGPAFVVAANHFKSKGCSEATGADADRHDGQSCWNAVRDQSASRLGAWLNADPTGSRSGLSLILGDLNAYAQEDPVRTLRAQGWIDAFTAAGIASPYSYVYNGQSGRLDHALLSPALAKRLKGAGEWHSNADEAANVGYQADNIAENGSAPWRSSDHDPLIIGLDLRR